MIPIIDFQERAHTGPVMKSTKFDVAFSMKLRDLVAERDIAHDPDQVVVDDETADRIFDAAVMLLAEIGLYHLDTHRVVQFVEEEIRQVAKEYRENPPEPVFGRGQDEITVRYRRCEEERPPILAAGMAGTIEQEHFVPRLQSFVQEETNEALGVAGGIISVDGLRPKAGTLSEMVCAQWECEQLLGILERAGRPDMHLGLLCTASSQGATMACMGPGLREPHNTQIGIHIMPEQKIDWDRLMLAKFCQDRGITPWTSCVSVMGGLCRNGADVAVALTANLLAQLCYGHGSLTNLFVNRMNGSWGDPETQWAIAGASRASERNICVPITCVCTSDMEVGRTEARLCQAAAMTVSYTANGFAYAWIAGTTGLEARLLGEVMRAAAGLPGGRATELTQAIFAVVAEMKNAGCSEEIAFPDLYDLEKVTPKPEHEAAVLRTKERLSQLGLAFD